MTRKVSDKIGQEGKVRLHPGMSFAFWGLKKVKKWEEKNKTSGKRCFLIHIHQVRDVIVNRYAT